jgi:hypothetical protein
LLVLLLLLLLLLLHLWLHNQQIPRVHIQLLVLRPLAGMLDVLLRWTSKQLVHVALLLVPLKSQSGRLVLKLTP